MNPPKIISDLVEYLYKIFYKHFILVKTFETLELHSLPDIIFVFYLSPLTMKTKQHHIFGILYWITDLVETITEDPQNYLYASSKCCDLLCFYNSKTIFCGGKQNNRRLNRKKKWVLIFLKIFCGHTRMLRLYSWFIYQESMLADSGMSEIESGSAMYIRQVPYTQYYFSSQRSSFLLKKQLLMQTFI